MTMEVNEIDAHVGMRVKELREARGVSQGRLGRHLGLTFSQVQKYEKGTNRIGAGRLYLLAGFLGVPVQYFFDGLNDGRTLRNGNGHANAKGPELAVLEAAFLAIPDQDTRQSLLALACSLSTTSGPAGIPKHGAS